MCSYGLCEPRTVLKEGLTPAELAINRLAPRPAWWYLLYFIDYLRSQDYYLERYLIRKCFL